LAFICFGRHKQAKNDYFSIADILRYTDYMYLPNLKKRTRPFVSLVFSQTKIQALKLDGTRKKVDKFAQVEIPPGVIINYKIKEPVALKKLLQDLFIKSGIKEKFVGVVIPEFSTYTKSLSLPNLSDTEIREALHWRMQDYLPTPIDEVVFDWRLVSRNADGVEVLVVAVQKEVLFSYINLVEGAGLLPLVVETPALSIERLIPQDGIGRISIYVTTKESLLVISQANKIIASSVIVTRGGNEVVTTALRMLAHYKELKIQEIMVGGVGLTQDLVQFLNYNLGRPVKVIGVKIAGLAPGQVQDFLIPISVQYKDPAEPDSELTINLLPPDWAKKYRNKLEDIQIWTISLFASVAIWAGFLSILIAFMFFSQQADALRGEVSQANVQMQNGTIAEVREVNALASTTEEIDKSIVYPQQIINSLSSTAPVGITISSYKLNFEDGSVVFGGFAADRSRLIELKEVLEKNKDYSGIDVPLAAFIKNENIPFDISFIYLPAKPAAKPKVKLK